MIVDSDKIIRVVLRGAHRGIKQVYYVVMFYWEKMDLLVIRKTGCVASIMAHETQRNNR